MTSNRRRGARSVDLPRGPGAYVLVALLDDERQMTVGKLGEFVFPPGWYVYCGSALRGLASRVEHHCRSDKKMHWHIDFLMRYATAVEVRWALGRQRRECEWSARLRCAEGAKVIARGFGSSDCRCESHLLWLPSRAGLDALGDGGVTVLSERMPRADA